MERWPTFYLGVLLATTPARHVLFSTQSYSFHLGKIILLINAHIPFLFQWLICNSHLHFWSFGMFIVWSFYTFFFGVGCFSFIFTRGDNRSNLVSMVHYSILLGRHLFWVYLALCQSRASQSGLPRIRTQVQALRTLRKPSWYHQ